VRTIVQGALDPTDAARLRAAVETACDDHGLETGGSFDALRAYALKLVTNFGRARGTHRPEPLAPLVLRVGCDEIAFRADDILVATDGRRIYRRVRTGVFRKADTEDLTVATTLLAITDNMPTASAEVVHLSSELVTPLTLTPLVLGRRRSVLEAAMADIRAGAFPTDAKQRVCPGCPAFFVCGPVPTGPLTKIF